MLAALLAAVPDTIEKKSGLPQLNLPDFAPQLIWLALTFLVLYVLLSRVALPRVGEVIEERQDRIQRDLDTAGRLKAETEKALAAYEQALADARGRASGIAKEARESLAAGAEDERKRIDALTSAKIGEAEGRIAATKVKALTSVNEIAAGAAGEIVTRLLGQGASPDEVRRALRLDAAE